MRDELFIRMLTGGDLEVEAPVGLHWKGRNARALFAVLALHPGAPVTRDRLAALLWPESDQGSARASLRMTLLGLRRTLEPLGAPLLEVTHEAVALHVARDAVDVSLFETLSAQPDPEPRARALTLYCGDLLAGLASPSEAFTDLVRTEGERLRASAIATGLALIGAFEDEGATDRLAATVRRLLSIDPASEPAHRAMIRSFLAAGDRAAALRQFEQCRAALRDHYDLKPSAETLALRDRIAAADHSPAQRPAAPDPTGRADAGWEEPAPERAGYAGGPRRWRLAALAAPLVAGGLLWLAWPARDPAGRDPAGPDVRALIAPIRAELSQCRRDHLERDVRLLLEEALIAIPNVTVILQRSSGEPDHAAGAYVLEAHVQCRERAFRISLSVQRAGSNVAALVGQYDGDDRTLEQLKARIMEDMEALLAAGRQEGT